MFHRRALAPGLSARLRPARQAWLPLLVGLAIVLALGWLVAVKTQGRSALRETAQLRSTQVTDLTATLTRSGYASEGTEVEVMLATPAFFRLTGRLQEAADLEADRFVVFVANETVHFGELPRHFGPVLRLDGQTHYVPAEVRVLADAVHHRTDVLIFRDLPVSVLDGSHSLELLLPQADGGSRAALAWDTPIEYPTSVRGGQGLTLGLLVALAAGLLAAISPCLLQLTAFYLPTLAGVSMDAGQGGLPLTAGHHRVMGTALLFVLGFTIPYTIGGALMGGLGQALAASGWLSPTGPVTTVAGVVMIGMAGLIAHRARAPLICKVPLPQRLQRSQRLPFLTTFASGFAIATGCLACFGGAILGVLLVYSGLLGSAALGALAMFVFSLGLAIPFLLAALSLSWVMPLAHRLQRLAPVIGLFAGLVMLFFGLVMVTGNFHVVSGWLFQNLPLS